MPYDMGRQKTPRGSPLHGLLSVGVAKMCKYVVDKWERKRMEEFEHYRGGTRDARVTRNNLM